MARPTIKITGDQRDAMYLQVRNHLAGLNNVFIALERQGDVPTAERLAREFSRDFRLLEDIGWHEEGSCGEVELTMPHSELSALMKRLRKEAKGGLDDASRSANRLPAPTSSRSTKRRA